MKKVQLIFMLSLLTNVAIGQNYIDLAKFDYAVSSPNSFDTGSVTTRLQEINGDFTLPIKVNDQFTILTGSILETTNASFDPTRENESLTGLTLKLGTNIKHNDRWSGTYMLLPKISSDFKKIANRDFQIGGVVLMKCKKTDHFNYNFGVYVNDELFGPFLVPIFGFYYLNPSEKFEAKVLLPLSVDLNYSFTKSFRFGLNFKGQIRSYNLNTPIGTEQDRYLARSTNDVYAYFQYGMKSGIHVQLGAGHSFGRSYRIYNEGVTLGMPLFNFGDNRTQLNTDFSDGWIFKIAAFYRLKLKP